MFNHPEMINQLMQDRTQRWHDEAAAHRLQRGNAPERRPRWTLSLHLPWWPRLSPQPR